MKCSILLFSFVCVSAAATPIGGRNVPEACGNGTTLICQGCNKLMFCIGDEPSLIQECAAGQTCLSGACKADTTGECDPYPEDVQFPCSTTGVFPDPANCRRYHICAPGCSAPAPPASFPPSSSSAGSGDFFPYAAWTGIPVDCENSDAYGYDAKSKACSKKLSDGKCSGYPIPPCLQGASGAVRDNPSLYYFCLPIEGSGVLYPYQLACPNGGVYSTTTRTCKSP